jgi:hypothetical protein
MMSKEDIFEQLKVIRDMLPEEHDVHQELQEIIWKVGEDIGEF